MFWEFTSEIKLYRETDTPKKARDHIDANYALLVWYQTCFVKHK